MNLQNVGKREVLGFPEFLKKVHDDKFKPFSPENQTAQPEKTGLSPIKRQPAYDYAGYADSVFAHQSKVDVPGIRLNLDKGFADAFPAGSAYTGQGASVSVKESSENSFIVKLGDFLAD